MAFSKKIATVTIVTRSYIPFARVLLDSIRKNYPDMSLYVILLDTLDGDCSCGDEVEVIPAVELGIPELDNMLERYTNTEMCVALKPFAVREIFRRSHDEIEGVIYMDSDIYVVSPMEELEEIVNDGVEIVLTPHLSRPSINGRTSDLTMLKCGAYNMGFAYFANTTSSRAILDWWAHWLVHFCYEDFTAGLFGDQKWMDLLPCFLDNFKILRHDGYNVAYWNIDQRPVTRRGAQWFASDVPLRFLHFSCPAIEPEPMFSKNLDRYHAEDIGELSLIVADYARRIVKAGLHEYSALPCGLRRTCLTRIDPRGNRVIALTSRDVRPMSKSVKVLCLMLLFPLACVMQIKSMQPRRTLQKIKAFGKSFLGSALFSPEDSYQWLQRQNAIIRFLTEKPFLLAVYLRRKARSIPALAGDIRKWGLSSIFAFGQECLGTIPVSPRGILVTDARVPHHDMIAADLTTFNLLKDLVSFGYTVTFLPWGAPWPDRYANDLRRLGVILDYVPEQHGSSADYVKKFGHRFSKFYLQPMGLASELVPIIRSVSPKAKIIFHAADICFVREQREAELAHDKKMLKAAAATKKTELDLIRKVDHLVVISDREKEFITAEIGNSTPISSFTCLYSKCVERPQPFENRTGVIFIGVFGHRPNVDAVLWFAKEVWPLVREHAPDMLFHVVGNYAPPEIQELHGKDGIIIEGFVENLDPLLSSVRIAVAPLRYGAGIKGKIGTTMGAGIPNVCTSIATEGMGIHAGEQALVADEPADFAAAVLQLHADPELWKKLSQAGQDLVKNQFSVEAGTRQFEQVLREAGLWIDKEAGDA
ncbi:glycosyltransferase family 4 protein [uncultured Desulfovibrio sp.]|uniref:glycosyltransferase family 4 protein n=1 Tax=uncultured Desulfovibrio sp. TaxID=167968 RepID=UPI00259A9A27|nr:glycosyltransferase family 4 protein [uncultured Desulfovibrio sp.]